MAISTRELADAALDAGLVTPEIVDGISGWIRLPPARFAAALTAAGRFPAAALYHAVAERRGIPFVDCDL